MTFNFLVNIPKSKTFVRELTTNNNAGNKSQQPVEATPEPQPSKKGRSETIIKIYYHCVSSSPPIK
jgi:hypothetical protein